MAARGFRDPPRMGDGDGRRTQLSGPKYEARINVPVTAKMYQLADLLAKRQETTLANVARQAIQEYLEAQEDLVNSRSRLGRTVMSRMDAMHSQLLRQLLHLSKLLLAAVIVLLSEQGIDTNQVVKRVTTVARQPALDKILEVGK